MVGSRSGCGHIGSSHHLAGSAAVLLELLQLGSVLPCHFHFLLFLRQRTPPLLLLLLRYELLLLMQQVALHIDELLLLVVDCALVCQHRRD
jgi:hypothetical protein